MISNIYEHKAENLEQRTIKRIVCSGGGAKGVSYVGAYAALEDSGVLRTVEEVAGASVGALISAFMALGVPKDELRQILFKANAPEWFGPRAQKNQEGVTFITRTGKPLEEFLRKSILSILKNKLKRLKSNDPRYHHIKNKVEKKTRPITFDDLAILRELFPGEFKGLAVNTVNLRSGEVQIFDAKRTPDVEIALACRASASIPILLEPVEITLNGKKEKFVDGGVYDNLPTDCFDLEAQEEKPAQRNLMRLQTLVFAFGDGLASESNEIFKALYGNRWDDVVAQEWIEDVIQQAFEKRKANILKARFEVERAGHFMLGLKAVFDELCKQKKFVQHQARQMLNVFKTILFAALSPRQRSNRYFGGDGGGLKENSIVKSLAARIKDGMRPILYRPGYLETIARDYLITTMGQVKTNFKNTAQKEKTYQKIRAHYALRTIALHSVVIRSQDFSKADKTLREMSAIGYLDTINYISNHDLQKSQFEPDRFYRHVAKNFICIYEAVLAGAGIKTQKNATVKEINQFLNQARAKGMKRENIGRELVYILKDKVEGGINSLEAFALSRAIEFATGVIDADALFKETYEKAFCEKGLFGQSKIAGQTIFKRSTLHQKLEDKSMFSLFHQKHAGTLTRSHKVFQALSRMDAFGHAYSRFEARLKR